ncbi:hypothetical protein [Selenihalanaerobacter shriftii]|uniref:DUF8042 domain-containing protein n=1 Tax=Selenihalanaerobacter shriftii TaxID=142842 RepID=A0A1T4KNN6_9FIRM|nr:hypothetical protein [Selenihalanaerobacter shriftii]SJZ43978.1 hypothetical protein SAMN02745118_00851 [Selenihalanaerobacter shriftii]
MKVYLNGQAIKELSNLNNIEKVLNGIYSRLNDEIIINISVNDVKVNESYLIEGNYDLNQISNIKFKTKKTNKLIQETLKQADEYLPKLKKGIIKTTELFRQGNIEEGNQKYQLCLEGLEWYTDALESILSLISNDQLKEEGKNKLTNINTILVDIMKAFQNEDMVFVADLLEYEIVDFIDELVEFNKKLMD